MGDDDQSIYGFRFNHPNGISDFHKAWSEYVCEDLSFSENRRCGDRILHAANLMMAEAGSKKRPMLPMSGRRGDLALIQWESIDDEICGLASFINSRSEESFLVLVPRRFIGYRLAKEIGDEARTAFTEEALEHPIAQEVFTAASLIADPDDFVATRVWLGFHGTAHIHATRRNTNAYASLPQDVGGHELIRRIVSEDVKITGQGRSHIKKRAKKAIKLIERSLDPGQVVDQLFDPALAKFEADEEKRLWLTDDLQELRDAAHLLLADQDIPDLGKMLSTLRYRIATRTPLMPENIESRVKIMTLHSAKGLEADNVVISGVADQLMPGIETDNEIIEEQKRLLYVAITRAKDSLVVSWPRKIQFDPMKRNRGRTDTEKIFRIDDELWVTTSRSSLLPIGLTGVIPGKYWLSQIT